MLQMVLPLTREWIEIAGVHAGYVKQQGSPSYEGVDLNSLCDRFYYGFAGSPSYEGVD